MDTQEELLDGIDLNSITLEEYWEILNSKSVSLDLPKGAKTVLYSGKIHGLMKTNSLLSDIEGVRLIRNTELGDYVDAVGEKLAKVAIQNDLSNGNLEVEALKKFYKNEYEYNEIVAQINNYKDLSSLEQDNLLLELYDKYVYDAENGVWAEVSKRFVRETPPDSEFINLCPEAVISGEKIRIWAAAEIPAALDNLPDEQIFGGYTIGELKSIRDTQGIEVVREMLKEQAIKDCADIKVFYGVEGNIVHMDASYLGTGSKVEVPETAIYETKLGITYEFADIEEVKTKYGVKAELSNLEMIIMQDMDARARTGSTSVISLDDLLVKHPFLKDAGTYDINAYRAKEYLTSIGASDDMIKKLGFYTDSDLKAKHDFLSDCTDKAILDEFRNYEYAKANVIESDVITKLGEKTIFLDADGKIIGLGEVRASETATKAAYTINVKDARNYLSNADMLAEYADFDKLTPLEQVRVKQCDCNFRALNARFENITISQNTMNKYLTASGKKADELNFIDKKLMKMADGFTGGTDDFANDLAKFVDSYKGLGKVAKMSMGAVDIFGTSASFLISASRAQYYYENGEYDMVEGIVAGFISFYKCTLQCRMYL